MREAQVFLQDLSLVLASGIKAATGPVGTALLAIDLIYSQFVSKWMDEASQTETAFRRLAVGFSDNTTGAALRANGGTIYGRRRNTQDNLPI